MTIRKPLSGNRTARRGSRYIQRPILARETAQEVKILILAEGRPYTPETVAAWIGTVVHALYLAYDAEIQAAAEEAYEGGVL